MSDEQLISFAGPFSWLGRSDAPSVFDVDEGRKSGIYLWTVPLQDGHLIYYVGETGRSFGERLTEHFKEFAAAMYSVHRAEEFARGEKVTLWPGHFGPDRKSIKDCIAHYPDLCEQIWKMTLILRFLLAPLSCEKPIRQRIETKIAQSLFNTEGIVGAFQDPAIRYSPKKEGEPSILCRTSSPVRLLGLPERFEA